MRAGAKDEVDKAANVFFLNVVFKLASRICTELVPLNPAAHGLNVGRENNQREAFATT